MKFVFYTNNISPHQLPVAHAIAKKVGYENFVYVGEEIAWRGKVVDPGGIKVKVKEQGEDEILETCEVLYTGGLRPIDLMERRAKKGLKTFYYSERWFKPIPLRGIKVKGEGEQWYLPGWMRLLVPGYRKMAKRFVKLVNENDCVKFLPIGPHAKRDFLKLGVRADKLVDWGYFVSPGVEKRCRCRKEGVPLKVLWAGRDIPLKHVGDIERAVVLANKNLTSALHLHLDSTPISFTKLTGVSPAEVRAAMHTHDTFVFASNAQEGWGAVVSEALEEGMNVIGTRECGACPAILPKERLYSCGDVETLARLLELEARGKLSRCSIAGWTAQDGAEKFLGLV